MKHIKFGNILSVDYGIIVHGCNSHGVMGSGIAVQIKNKYPKAFNQYYAFIKECEHANKSPLGECVTVEVVPSSVIIVNGITQADFGRDTKRYVNYEAVQKVFNHAVDLAYLSGMPVHYPLIGAGLGGGDWAIISEIIDNEFRARPDLDRYLWIYES